jgi:chromosome segregation ATPase
MKTDNMLRNSLKRRWGKYYEASEVEDYFTSLMQAIAPERKELRDLRELFKTIQREKEEHKETTAELEKRAVRIAEEAAIKAQETIRLDEQLARGQVENARLNELLAQQAIELTKLQTRADKLGKLLAHAELHNPVDKIIDAELKVKHLLDKAMNDKDQLLKQSYEKHSRMIAASRAAYYHALQFKQDLADHYHRMEEGLNASIDVLRQTETVKFAPHRDDELPIGESEQVFLHEHE